MITQTYIKKQRRNISIAYVLGKIDRNKMVRLCQKTQTQTMKTKKKTIITNQFIDKCMPAIEASSLAIKN